MMHVRDQVSDIVVEALKGAAPALENRVFREGMSDWNGLAYPAAVVVSGPSGTRRISGNAGYMLEARLVRFTVAIGVREYADEDPIPALSSLLVDVEDAVLALMLDDRFEDVEVKEISPVINNSDAEGDIVATTVEFMATVYANAGQSSVLV